MKLVNLTGAPVRLGGRQVPAAAAWAVLDHAAPEGVLSLRAPSASDLGAVAEAVRGAQDIIVPADVGCGLAHAAHRLGRRGVAAGVVSIAETGQVLVWLRPVTS